MRRFGAWFAILVLALYLVFIGGSWFGIYRSDLRSASVFATAAALSVWLVVAWRQPEWRPRSVLFPAILAALGSLLLSTVTSRFPRQSMEYLAYAVLLAALYLLLVRILASPFLRARLAMAATALCGILSLAYVLIVFSDWLRWWSLVGSLAVPPLRPGFESLTYGNPAAVMTMAVLLFASAAATLGFATQRSTAVLAMLGALVSLVVIMSGSRAGWLAVAIAVLGTGVLWLVSPAGRREAAVVGRSVVESRVGRIGLGIGLVAAVAGAVMLGPGILARFGAGGTELRAAYFASAIRMFEESPIVGTGPGSWVIQRAQYTIAPEPDYYIPHAHSIYLQTLAELGVVGVAAGLLLLVGLVLLIRGAMQDADPARRRWGWAAMFVLIYLAAHQLLDFYMNMVAVLFAVALPVAWLDATSPSRVTGRWTLPTGARSALAAIAVVALAASSIGLLVSERTASQFEQAVAQYDEGDWTAADNMAQTVAFREPDWPPYQFTMGLTAASVGDHARAAEAFRTAALADDLPEAWLDLAAEQAILGQDDEARSSLTRAARLGLQRPALALAIGDLALRLGDAGLVEEGFSMALSKLPSLAGDEWWQRDLTRAARFPAVLGRAIAGASPDLGWQIALAAGEADRARALAATLYPPGSLANDIIDAWLGDLAALERVEDTCRGSPTSTGAVDWCARLAARSGDLHAADAYREWSFLNLGDPAGPFEVRVAKEPIIGRNILGSVADFYGTYTYRRPTPWNPLVPSLPQLTAE